MAKKDEETPPAVEQNDEFADLENQKEIYGRVYRITSPVDSVGRPSSEFVGKVTERVFEDYIGPIFGPGRYKIHYRVTRSDGSKFERDEYFNIGKEFAKKEPAAPIQAPAPSLDLGGILGGLTVEKITAIGAGLKLIKDFLAPPPPPPAVDVAKLLEIFAANNRPQPVSDALLIQAMQSLQKTNTSPSLIQQMRELKEAKQILTDEIGADDNDGEGGQMNFLIEQAFKYLPSLLAAKQNNFQAVGREVSTMPMVAGLIRNNPDLATEFVKRASATYGAENAAALAAGFGLQIQQQAPQAPQQAQETADDEGEG